MKTTLLGIVRYSFNFLPFIARIRGTFRIYPRVPRIRAMKVMYKSQMKCSIVKDIHSYRLPDDLAQVLGIVTRVGVRSGKFVMFRCDGVGFRHNFDKGL